MARRLIVLAVVFLTGCAFVENMMSRQALPDQRIVVYKAQWLRVPYRELDNYRCYDGGPIMAEPYGAANLGTWEITCE